MNATPAPARRVPRAVLETAARTSLRAPSVFNTQPWTWHIGPDAMELSTDRARQLAATDPDGRLILLSCGTALHHARVTLAADGWSVTVTRFPDPDRPGVLARLTVEGPAPADPAAARLREAISRRRTDRRAFGDRPIAPGTITALRRAVEAEGAYLHVLPRDRVPMLGMSVEWAADAEASDPAYRSELTAWTNRPSWTGDGVPPATAVEPALRRVPVREFAPYGGDVLPAGEDHDEGAEYVILFGDGAEPLDLLRAGEALSALLLAATADGLATATISEAVEVSWSRVMLRELVSGLGEPYVVVRLGYVEADEPLPATPRRAANETITFTD